jgi:hypothetical protein
MTHLALLHFQGTGVPQSDAPGLQWLQSARILLQASSSCRVQNAQVIVFSS